VAFVRDRKRRTRAIWPALAAPGIIWLLVLFVVPFYAVLSVSFGTVDPIFRSAIPRWNPLDWNRTAYRVVWDGIVGGQFEGPFIRTFVYVGIALLLCFAIGFPVAYYVARFGGRWKTLLIVLLILPFWISYLMRMLAWVNLLQNDGYVNDVLTGVGILDEPRNWLDGQAPTVVMGLVYGYIPFFILPLYAALDRIDSSVLEASRDLGANRIRTFWHVTLPLSRHGLLAAAVITALPMFGDYYTTDLLSASPKTTMIGNQIRFFLNTAQVRVGAALVVVLSLMLLVLMAYYLVNTARASREAAPT
jgi:ABC-type spermidine/putrescine transport system permease subunit I